jgi:hypothetical protein
MDIAQRKEQFSAAFLRAVASVAGYTLAKPEVDDDSIDWIIASKAAAGLTRRPRVEVQMKCSARDLIKGDFLHFPLEIKNYNDLRDTNILVPRVLVVMTVPNALNEWLTQSDTEIAMRHCGYWMSLRGMATVPNTANVMVRIPCEQMFTPAALSDIMSIINAGGTP